MVDIVDKALRMGEGRQIKKLEHVAQATDALEDEIAALNDEELKGQTAKFKQRLDNGESLDKLMPEAFATCLLYTSPSPRDRSVSRMPSSA